MLSIRLLRAWLRALAPAFVEPHPSATASATPASPSRHVQAVHQLPQAHTLTLAEPLGHALVCLAGCIWITQDGDPRDVVINAGQVFTPDRNRRTLIHALEASQVRMAGRAAGAGGQARSVDVLLAGQRTASSSARYSGSTRDGE